MLSMNYSKSLLLYQFEPAPGTLLKSILMTVPAMLLIASIFLWSSSENTGGLILLTEAIIISLIFWLIYPRSYQVYEDHLRIVLGGPFGVNVQFAQISKIEVTSKTDMTMNFTTTITRTYVRIVKKQGLNIAITPKNADLFTENANRALSKWVKTANIV